MGLNLIKLGKKGIFFTLIAITIVTILMFSLTGAPKVNYYKDKIVLESEFLILNSFVKDLKDNYVKNVLYTQSKRALIALVNITKPSGSGPIPNLEARFEELVLNGEYLGVSRPEMKEMAMHNWSNEISNLADNLYKIESNFTIENINIYQTSPWFVDVSVDALINASKRNISYHMNKSINLKISIIGLNDPIFSMAGYERLIEKSTINNYNISTIDNMIISGDYRENSWAPNFIMRLQNDTRNSTCCGIESLINSSFPVIPGDGNVSYVDYLFWSTNRSCVDGIYSIYNFTGFGTIPQAFNFKLDLQYMGFYGINETEPGLDRMCILP